jgi:tetratricopeptide (TPR) repeat protein
LQVDKTLWPAINNIGLVQYEAGDTELAIDSWKSAISLDEKASEPKLALGVALYVMGDQTAGIQHAQDALNADNRYSDVDFLIENLWGDRLIKDTQTLLNTPMIQSTLSSFKVKEPLN